MYCNRIHGMLSFSYLNHSEIAVNWGFDLMFERIVWLCIQIVDFSLQNIVTNMQCMFPNI